MAAMKSLAVLFSVWLRISACCVLRDTAMISTEFMPSPVAVKSAADCQVSCKNLNACQYFVFKTSTSECSLLFTKTGTKTQAGTVSGNKFCGRDQVCFFDGGNYNSANIDVIKGVSSYHDCQKECQKSSTCLTFTVVFVSNPVACVLKLGAAFYPAIQPGQYNSGRRLCEESYCLDYRTVYNGYAPTSVAWVPSATHCQFECQKNDRCQFFTFNTTSGQCALKLSKGSVQSLNYAISGPKFCATKKGFNKYTEVKKLASMVTALDQKQVVPTAMFCAIRCNNLYLKNDQCTGFSFNETNNVCHTFIFAPGSINFYFSDEQHQDIIFIREDIYNLA